MSYNEIFISCCDKDKLISSQFYQTMHKIVQNTNINIFCYLSDENRHSIGAGESISNKIKEEIKNCKVLIALLSKNYFNSKMCLYELGVAWGLNKIIVPIILPGLTFNDYRSSYLIEPDALYLDFGENFEKLKKTLIEKCGLERNDRFNRNLSLFKEFLDKNSKTYLNSFLNFSKYTFELKKNSSKMSEFILHNDLLKVESFSVILNNNKYKYYITLHKEYNYNEVKNIFEEKGKIDNFSGEI